MAFKSKGLSPYKYTRKNKTRPKQTVIGTDANGNLIYKETHKNKVSTKLSLSQKNMMIIRGLRPITIINEERVITKVDNYNCKQRRLIKRMEERALREAA